MCGLGFGSRVMPPLSARARACSLSASPMSSREACTSAPTWSLRVRVKVRVRVGVRVGVRVSFGAGVWVRVRVRAHLGSGHSLQGGVELEVLPDGEAGPQHVMLRADAHQLVDARLASVRVRVGGRVRVRIRLGLGLGLGVRARVRARVSWCTRAALRCIEWPRTTQSPVVGG